MSRVVWHGQTAFSLFICSVFVVTEKLQTMSRIAKLFLGYLDHPHYIHIIITKVYVTRDPLEGQFAFTIEASDPDLLLLTYTTYN